MRFPTPANRSLTAALLAAALFAGACGQASDDIAVQETTTTTSDGEVVRVSSAAGFFDNSVVHDIVVDFDQDDYDEMVAVYVSEGEKEWIEATITIDGTTFENVGIRLKGNSSLFGLTAATSGNPEDLPWLIKLDKYVDDQNYEGINDIVIRSNSTETAMNEAVAQELLALTGLAAEDPVATTFIVNGSEAELRLAIEHPDEIWEEDNFDADEAALYKADSEGDYSYRGTDWDSYEDVFDQKVGEDDLDPLIEFLDFINNSDDATFAAELGERLDLESFATYLAFQDLIQNGDDIDGRGNNSYLHYSYDEDRFTVVSWDLNLAFGTANVNGGGPGQAGGGRPVAGNVPTDDTAPAESAVRSRPAGGPAAGGGGGGASGGVGAGGSNVLASRFLADDTFSAMYDQAVTELTEALFTSGAADEIVNRWTELLSAEADGLVPATTIDAEAAAISTTFPSA